ncbi:MAG: SpoIIE family protein phosphatase [Pirellulales bacterium]|nr:SpoIIE family protein phosphatase [Pirellulales bacterium]
MSIDADNAGNDALKTLPKHTATVLLVDDQPIVAEAVRRMLAEEGDIVFHYCSDPTKAIGEANRLAPTVILQDLVMPELDGLTLVKFFRANPPTREIPLIVLSTKEEPIIKAQAFAVGANDYLVKLPDKLEMLARIRYHSRGYIAQLERNEAYRRLAESQKQLADEVAQAAKYVCSLLPEPIDKGPVRVDWRFVPSMQLGGDSFGYHWLDEDHFAVYLLDVSGHGVGASLLSVSAMNVLRSQSLPNTDFRDPGQVLRGLNTTFDMDLHDNKYFTIWYGVYRQSTRQLLYAGGGHPPALLCKTGDGGATSLQTLDSTGPIIGMVSDLTFETNCIAIEPDMKLYLFSDGVFEIDRPDGEMWKFEEFLDFISSGEAREPLADCLLAHVQELHDSKQLSDDFSMVEVAF